MTIDVVRHHGASNSIVVSIRVYITQLPSITVLVKFVPGLLARIRMDIVSRVVAIITPGRGVFPNNVGATELPVVVADATKPVTIEVIVVTCCEFFIDFTVAIIIDRITALGGIGVDRYVAIVTVCLFLICTFWSDSAKIKTIVVFVGMVIVHSVAVFVNAIARQL